MTTLEDVRERTHYAAARESESYVARITRDEYVRSCYAYGNATLQQLANATGLSKARIQQIVKDGEA